MAMVNKMKFWRKMAKKQPDGTRTGRAIRNYMGGTNHPGMLSPIHIWLFRAAGIPTPVYDEQQKKREEAISKYNATIVEATKLRAEVDSEQEFVGYSQVQDVEFAEGTV